MSASFRLRGAALGLAATLLAGAVYAAPQQQGPKPTVIKDPHYGDGLFHFYDEQYFSALTSLMVSQHFGRVSQHADEAEILRGGLLLSYGLHREAGEIFARLIERGAAPPVRDRAWFYLAKIRYQRDLPGDAEDALNRVGTQLPPALEEDRVLLKANLLMARADYAAAAEVLRGLAGDTDAGWYARYNLGVALIKDGDLKGGTALLDELGLAPAANEERRGLRDKANLALGFAALQDNRPEAAQIYLERVRLNGLQANKALLGFGWAATVLKNPRQALAPWTELAQRDPGDAAVLEARIALPYALAELGAYGQSLAQYNEAIALFERESTGLDESIAAIRAGRLVQGLMDLNPGEQMGWFWHIARIPDLPHTGHLTQLLAQHEFQEAFKNFRDLQFVEKNLTQWVEQLAVYGDMLENRRQAYAQRLPDISAKARHSGLAELQRRRDELARELVRAEADADGVAFADTAQQDLMKRLENVRAILEKVLADPALAAARDALRFPDGPITWQQAARALLERDGADPEFAAAYNKYRLASGALAWQLAEQFPPRAWEAWKGLKGVPGVDSELEQARRRDAALAQAQRDEPARFERFAARIAALGQRLQALLPQITALQREQQQVVQELAVAQLVRQKERLAEYTTQARFAVAQLVDRAHLSRSEDHAKP
jgi:hypothetical protein